MDISLTYYRKMMKKVSVLLFSAALIVQTAVPPGYTQVGEVPPGAGIDSPVRNYAGIDPDTFSIPAHMGEVKSAFKGASDRFVVHIQDAHCNPFAQRRVADIITYLNNEYGITMVNLEGGVGPYDLSVFYGITGDEIRREVAEYFVKKGEINGAEYFAINNPGKVTLWGVEDKDLYIANLKVYRDSINFKSEIDEYLGQLYYMTDNLKTHIYSPDLMDIDKKYHEYKSGGMAFREYISFILKRSVRLGINMDSLGNIDLLARTLEQEKQIDFEEANDERDRIIGRLKKTLSQKELNELLARSVEFKTKKIKGRTFYKYLFGKAAEINMELDDFPVLGAYLEYIDTYESIDRAKILEELGLLESRIKDHVCRNDEEKDLVTLSRHLAILKNIFGINVNKSDFRYYAGNRDQFDVSNYLSFYRKEAPKYRMTFQPDEGIARLDDLRDDISVFYGYSFKRDEAFMKNIRFPGRGTGAGGKGLRPAVLFTGGFHTENLCDLMEKEGISYVSILPRFTTSRDWKNPYFEILSGETTGIQEVLRSALMKPSMMAVPSKLNSIADSALGDNARVIMGIRILLRERIVEEIVRTGARTGIIVVGTDNKPLADMSTGAPVIFGDEDPGSRKIEVALADLLAEIEDRENAAGDNSLAGEFRENVFSLWENILSVRPEDYETTPMKLAEREALIKSLESEGYVISAGPYTQLEGIVSRIQRMVPAEARSSAMKIAQDFIENVEIHGGGWGILMAKVDEAGDKLHISVMDPGKGFPVDAEGRPEISTVKSRGALEIDLIRQVDDAGRRGRGIALGEDLLIAPDLAIYSKGHVWQKDHGLRSYQDAGLTYPARKKGAMFMASIDLGDNGREDPEDTGSEADGIGDLDAFRADFKEGGWVVRADGPKIGWTNDLLGGKATNRFLDELRTVGREFAAKYSSLAGFHAKIPDRGSDEFEFAFSSDYSRADIEKIMGDLQKMIKAHFSKYRVVTFTGGLPADIVTRLETADGVLGVNSQGITSTDGSTTIACEAGSVASVVDTVRGRVNAGQFTDLRIPYLSMGAARGTKEKYDSLKVKSSAGHFDLTSRIADSVQEHYKGVPFEEMGTLITFEEDVPPVTREEGERVIPISGERVKEIEAELSRRKDPFKGKYKREGLYGCYARDSLGGIINELSKIYEKRDSAEMDEYRGAYLIRGPPDSFYVVELGDRGVELAKVSMGYLAAEGTALDRIFRQSLMERGRRLEEEKTDGGRAQAGFKGINTAFGHDPSNAVIKALSSAVGRAFEARGPENVADAISRIVNGMFNVQGDDDAFQAIVKVSHMTFQDAENKTREGDNPINTIINRVDDLLEARGERSNKKEFITENKNIYKDDGKITDDMEEDIQNDLVNVRSIKMLRAKDNLELSDKDLAKKAEHFVDYTDPSKEDPFKKIAANYFEFANLEQGDILYREAENVVPVIINILEGNIAFGPRAAEPVKTSDMMRKSAPTYCIEPIVNEEDMSFATNMLKQAERNLNRADQAVTVRGYVADENLQDNLLEEISRVLPDFVAGSEKDGRTRMSVRIVTRESDVSKQAQQRETVTGLIRDELVGMGLGEERIDVLLGNRERGIEGKLRIIQTFIGDVRYINTVSDLFTDILLMECDRYGKEDGYPGEIPPDLGARLYWLLFSTNYDFDKLEPADISEAMSRIFNGDMVLRIRKINWESIREWKRGQDEILRSL